MKYLYKSMFCILCKKMTNNLRCKFYNTFSIKAMIYFMTSLKLSSSMPASGLERPLIISGMTLYKAFPFLANSVKNSLAIFDIFSTSSTIRSAISDIWPFTLIMSFKMRWVRTVSVLLRTNDDSSLKHAYIRGVHGSTVFGNRNDKSPKLIKNNQRYNLR